MISLTFIIILIVIIVIYGLYSLKEKIVSYFRNLNWPSIDEINQCLEPKSDSIVPSQTIHYSASVLSSESINSVEARQYFRVQPENTNKFFMEEQCRFVFEDIFKGFEFKKIRPNWLKNPTTNRNMELDGYNETLKLAFEYNGYQHYIFPNKFHRRREDFLAQKERDLLKLELCNRAGIYLLTIPYNVPLRHLRSFIKRYLPRHYESYMN